MKNHLIVGAVLLCGGTLVSASVSHAQDIEIASDSPVASISLPDGAMRFAPEKIPSQITDILGAMVKKGSKRGQTEVLGWAGKDYSPERAAEYKANLSAALERAGWQYKEGEQVPNTQGSTMISVQRTSPTRRTLVGFWAPTNSALLLAWTEILSAGGAPPRGGANGNTRIVPPRGDAGEGSFVTPSPEEVRANPAVSFEIPGGSGRHIINVSKGQKPTRVSFPVLTPKAGFVRGYVKDGKGKALVGATIGVRSSATGGFYSGANGKTDAKGYYEISVPWGAAEFYNAGYSMDYYDSRASFGLLPADGEASSFATANGLVENWVLPSFGVGDPDEVADQPQYFGNYYGGSFSLGYFASDPRFGNDGGLPQGASIEVSLVPVGPLLDGTKGRNYVFKQPVEDGIALGFTAVNIPVGQYRVVALLRQNGRNSTLKIEESGPNQAKPFGLEPKKTTESAILTFRPGSAKSDKVAPGKSNWDALAFTLKP